MAGLRTRASRPKIFSPSAGDKGLIVDDRAGSHLEIRADEVVLDDFSHPDRSSMRRSKKRKRFRPSLFGLVEGVSARPIRASRSDASSGARRCRRTRRR
jgi:hypothetical protein